MRRKFYILFILVCAWTVSSGYAADRISIQDIEYLKGDDFVQLHFVTDKIISIPDVFYPDENDTKNLVMRIPDADFTIKKESFSFDSPVIEKVQVVRHDPFLDVKIRLKDKVNYRVFTNAAGLYIEFPEAKGGTSLSAPTATGKRTLPAEKEESPAESRQVPGARNVINDVRVAEKNEGKIKFEFVMNRPTDYTVIPITQAPVRLAIDLADTYSRPLNRQVGFLNVKGLRGALHSAGVYRIVFDLDSLRSYSVALNKNVLEVEFFDPEALARRANQLQSEPIIQPLQTDPGPQTPAQDPLLQEAAPQLKLQGGNRTEVDLTEVAEQKPAEEFFSEEKSAVAEQPPAEKNTAATNQQSQGALMRNMTIEGEKQWSGEVRSYHLKNQDLQNLLIHFARDSGLSMVFDPDISGKVTAELTDVPWDQALDIFLRQNGLDMVREGNVIRIGKVEKLAKEAEDRRKLRESKQQEAELNTYIRNLNYAKATDVKKILDKSLTARGNIIFDDRSNTLVITEVPGNIGVIDGLIKVLDMPNPQVAIEARIVETNSNYTQNLGIQWGPRFIADSAYGNQTSLKFPNSFAVYGNQLVSDKSPFLGPLGGYAVNLPAGGATSGAVFSMGNVANTFRLDVALSAMQMEGKGRIIQSPRLVTQNNMESRVSQGNKIPVQTLQNNTIQVRYIDAVLELKVTPTITADDTITLAIDIKNDNADFGNLVQNIPPMTTQSAKTTVRVQNGATIVIGGMYKIEKASSSDGVPLLRKLPLIGNLFKSTSKRGVQRETLIFITPRIVR